MTGIILLQALPLPAQLLHVLRPVLTSLAAHLPHTDVGVGDGGETGGGDVVPGVPGLLLGGGGGQDSVGVGGHHVVVDWW